MKLHGDVPEEHKKLAEELTNLEKVVDSKVGTMPRSIIAKSFVCLACDSYKLGMEEEGHRLLEKAEDACPGYFRDTMLQQTEEDELFGLLVRTLTSELAWIILSRLKDIRG